ncbi:MAG: fatty acid desaturase [Sulfitobacter sp.]
MSDDLVSSAARSSVLIRLQKAVRRWDMPTIAVLLGCVMMWASALMLSGGLVQWGMIVFALTLHSSLSHEILHGHPFNSDRAGTVLGLVQPGLFVPYLRFKALHLAHHRDANLTDPYDDPETQYLDPAVWVGLPRMLRGVLTVNNTLLGRMVIGPLIGMSGFIRSDWRAVRAGEKNVAWHWLMHAPGVGLTLWVVSLSQMSIWAYLAACYGALSVLRIRTFLEHRADEHVAGRTVIIEDRGILAFLFLNNNFHAVHHMHPDVAWYQLPALYRDRKHRFQRFNKGYVYRSYGAVFARYFLRTKDPVAHPLWHQGDE